MNAYRAKNGKDLTESDLEALAAEAEQGYDVDQLQAHAPDLPRRRHKLLQAPPLTDYEAATAKVIGPDAVDEAPTLQGRYRVYEVDLETAQEIIASNAAVYERRYTYQGDEKVKGVCFIDEQPCGCVFEIDGPDGEHANNFQRCQEHSHYEKGWCCEESVSYRCVCMMAQWCPTHGDQHHGTHD